MNSTGAMPITGGKNKAKYFAPVWFYSFSCMYLLIAHNYVCQLLAHKLIYTWGTLNNDSGRLQIYEAQQF